MCIRDSYKYVSRCRPDIRRKTYNRWQHALAPSMEYRGCHINDDMNDDDELPLSSLWRQSKSPKRKGKTKTGLSPSPRRRRSKGKAPKKTTLRVYGFNGDLLGDATDIAASKLAHKKDIPAKIGFVVLGPAGAYMIDSQQQLDAIPAGNSHAHAVFVHPTEARSRAFNRRLSLIRI